MQHDDVIRLLLDRRGALQGYIATILPDRHAGEDVFQETLIKASAQAAIFDHPGHCLAWVRSTARNLALNETRKAHRRSVALDEHVLDLLDTAWAQHDDEHSRDEVERLEHCLERLTPYARSLIRLRYADDLDCATIANRMGKTLNAVHVALSRTYKALAACVQGREMAV